MDTIIIFTNWQRIYDLQDHYKLSWIPENIPIQKIPVSNDKTIIIAWDEMPIFTELVNLVDNNANIYVLHHNSPNNAQLMSLNNLLSAKGCEIKMVHGQHDHIEYITIQDIDACVNVNIENPQIIDFIEVTDKQKLNNTFETLKGMLSGDPILEAKLDLLHKCLLPSSAPKQEIFDSEFKILKVYEDGYKSFLTSINSKKDDDVFNADYIEAVKQLRIALLGS